MTITQELYNTIYFNLNKMGYPIFETLPQGEVPYPFIVMGALHKRHRNLKTAIRILIDVNIDVWGNSESRFSVDDIVNEIDSVTTVETEHWQFIKRINESDCQILHDNSTHADLLHGILDLTFESR